MMPYEELDAFKVCHDLTLAVYRAAEQLEERDPELAAQLWSAAIFASGRIAAAWGFATGACSRCASTAPSAPSPKPTTS